MDKRVNKLIYLALIPAIVVALLWGLSPDGLYQRVSGLMLTTASMEAAANGGAIGEHLPTADPAVLENRNVAGAPTVPNHL
ncbi:MAG: hypothetical protein QOF90_2992 [Acetobacteraceae bacterium]|nr:hypothetical protein [Acetobacteraceae bacterium]